MRSDFGQFLEDFANWYLEHRPETLKDMREHGCIDYPSEENYPPTKD